MAQQENETQAQALAIREIELAKSKMYSHMLYLSRCDSEGLRACGHTDLGKALIAALKHTTREIEVIEKRFFKRFPD